MNNYLKGKDMKLEIQKEIIIDAKVDKVFNLVSDFKHWNTWSPWRIMEPNAFNEISDDGRKNSWAGELVGMGTMVKTSEVPNIEIFFDLKFLKPFKSKAKCYFKFSELNLDQTKVTWVMDSSIPFFLFFMKKMMTAMIGMDYERGLKLLKYVAEKGHVQSKISCDGVVEGAGFPYVGIESRCSLDEIGADMESNFRDLMELAKNHPNIESETCFSLYHKFDIVKKNCHYTAGLKYIGKLEVSSEFTKGELGSSKALKVSHLGAYHHLGNAWSLWYSVIRNKKLKENKSLDPIEFYRNDPRQVSVLDIKTDIYLPIK